MALLPIQGCVAGDFVLNLVPIDTEDTMDVVATKIAHHSVRRRVAARDKPLLVRFNGHTLATDATPVSAGIGPMDFVEAFYQD